LKEQFEGRMLRVYFGESDRWEGKRLHEAILARCKELGIGSAVVYRGVEGYGSSTRIHRASPWKFSRDAPMMVTILDTEAQIARLVPHLDAMVGEGLIASSKVDVIRLTRAGQERESA
jgi:PII-like signaling protein